ncbi:MAG TPA: hypothetical protein PKA63_07520 [Oligoflexia bacterium]|nr:hypothetical protein [Oligoflexia bacterium]HMP48498.1 hypothetical protein [Oligoflexia bacterium]
MEISLPEIIQFQQTHAHETAWSDHYGALYVAAAYCGMSKPDPHFPHVWQHGSEGPWSPTPEMMVCNTPDARKKKLFVARKDEEERLIDAGFEKAQAIGLPIVYVSPQPVKRTSNTLLIMPQHSLVGMKRGSREDHISYVESLKPYISSFDAVAACVSPSCLINGYFIEEFKSIGVDIIPGALTSDLNALLRMRCLMEQFEYMTTNGWGSHFAYALSFGMKVSAFGKHLEIEDKELLKDITWASFDEQTRKDIRDRAKQGENQFLTEFIAEPTMGKENKDLGEWLIGAGNKKSPESLKQLFEWEIN